jgi:hypothetical protein
MSGGLMQLVAYGAQDIYLTGNPQITFFKIVYRRHTNFSIESISQTFTGKVDFGERISCTISRNGDLLTSLYLEIMIDSFYIPKSITKNKYFIPRGSVAKTCFINKIGHGLLKYVECEIGGQIIDKHYGEWMEIWAQLTKTNYNDKHFNYLVTTDSWCVDDEIGNSLKLYIPLQFWFCDNPGLALPLIALQYHDVKINVQIEDLKHLIRFDAMAGIPRNSNNAYLVNNPVNDAFSTFVYNNGMPVIPDNVIPEEYEESVDDISDYLTLNWNKFRIKGFELYCDYIFLDTDERRRFAQVSHEYLIHQVQFNGSNSVSKNINAANIELDFNHPIKELIWVIENDPHLEFDEIGDSYKGIITSCANDPADRFFWLNNCGTPPIDSCYRYDSLLNMYQKDNPSSVYNKNDFNLLSTPMLLIGGTTGMNLGNDQLIESDKKTVNAEFIPTTLTSRSKSSLRFYEQLESAVLQINGMDRFPRRDGRYFKWVQTYQHHTGFHPGVNNIYCYSFGLNPEKYQPSGTCNFSRIDSASLNLKLFKSIIGPKNYLESSLIDFIGGSVEDKNLTSSYSNVYTIPVDRKVKVYALNYNVLRIMSGMGGLAYSS